MKPKIYIAYKIPMSNNTLSKLNENFSVDFNQLPRLLSQNELINNLKNSDGAIVLLSDNINKRVIDALPNIKIYANYAVGYNNIDLKYATSKNITITNTPGVLSDATAETAFALMICVARKITESDKFIRDGKFKGAMPDLMLGQALTGKTLGLIGAGLIGLSLAKKVSGFDMKILYHNRTINSELETKYNAKYVSKEELLKNSDFISIHTPLTEETFHLISENEFGIMKKNAILINTARGPVVDEKALVKALKLGQILGVGLDVFESEPIIRKELLEANNAVLLPHIGSATLETRQNMAETAVDNLTAFFNGQTPPNAL